MAQNLFLQQIYSTNGSQIVLGLEGPALVTTYLYCYGAFNVADVYTQSQSNARYMQLANNLSDVASAPTALTNLGITSTSAELNKLDAVSRGSLIYGNASAETALLTKGTANQVLTSDGTDIAWAAPAAGGTSGLQVLSTVTASNSATVDIETTFDSTYDDYVLFISNLTTSSNNNSLFMLVKNSSYQTSGYQDKLPSVNSGSSSFHFGNGGYTTGIIIAGNVGNHANAQGRFQLNISNVSNSGKLKSIFSTGSWFDNGNDPRGGFAVGSCNASTDAVTGLRFKMETGNIMTGIFRLYGVAKS